MLVEHFQRYGPKKLLAIVLHHPEDKNLTQFNAKPAHLDIILGYTERTEG